MKKTIWILAIVALAVTAALLPFLPETVPVHFDAAWNADRWGSPYELFLLPALLLVLAAVWTAVLSRLEKKAAEAEDDKVRAGALTNRKAIGIAGISLTAVLTLLQAWLLFVVSRAAEPGGEVTGAGLERLPFILVGLLFVVMGNIMPKTRRNGLIGFRISWSMYNDAAAAIPSPLAAIIVLLAFLTGALIVTLVYARRVYTEEKAKESAE